jgi:hypothetical protein
MATDVATRAEVMDWMPAMTTQEAAERHKRLKEFVHTQMVEGRDYGKNPGSDKPTLLKPGAEKLLTLFGLSAALEVLEKITDWTGAEHGGEPFFFWDYRCSVSRDSRFVAACDGSCNSWEQKYRYRKAAKKCPICNSEAIIPGKEEYGGGWLCWKKKGGCGAKFSEGDQRIDSQPTGRVRNPDVFDQVNTVEKMAIKRALVGATMIAVNASEFFTQDLEDFDENNHEPASNPQPRRAQNNNGAQQVAEPKPAPSGPELVERFRERLNDKDKTMAAANLITPGALKEYVRQEALAAGWSDDISSWDEGKIRMMGETCKHFIERKEKGLVDSRQEEALRQEVRRREVAEQDILEFYQITDFGGLPASEFPALMAKLKQAKIRGDAASSP